MEDQDEYYIKWSEPFPQMSNEAFGTKPYVEYWKKQAIKGKKKYTIYKRVETNG